MAVCGRPFYASYPSSNTIAVKGRARTRADGKIMIMRFFNGEGLEEGSGDPGRECVSRVLFATSWPWLRLPREYGEDKRMVVFRE